MVIMGNTLSQMIDEKSDLMLGLSPQPLMGNIKIIQENLVLDYIDFDLNRIHKIGLGNCFLIKLYILRLSRQLQTFYKKGLLKFETKNFLKKGTLKLNRELDCHFPIFITFPVVILFFA